MSAKGSGVRLLSEAFLAVVIAFFMAVVPLPRIARAACGGFNGYTVESPSHDGQYGVRVNANLAINPVTGCGIVRTVTIWDNSSNYVEVGWFEDDGAGGFHFAACQDFGSPHVLVFAAASGYYKCMEDPPVLTGGDSYSFRVDNPDHDSDFVYYWDDDTTPSVLLGFYATDITHGWPKTWDERHEPDDSLRATLTGFNSMGGQGEWHNYPSPVELNTTGSVSGWQVCAWASDHLTVKSAGSC